MTIITLAQPALEQYQTQGYYHPIEVLTPTEAADYRQQLEGYEARSGGPIGGPYRHKSHLLFPWLNELIRHPKILDSVEAILGPDILCWATNFFIKEAHDPSYVSWHQDSTYWGLSRPDVLTAWVALSDSRVENGCMRVLPGSHGEQLGHRDTFAKNNLLSRGQEIEVEVDEAKAVDITLQPGEMSLHHVKLIHGSGANHANDRRIGFAVRYVPTYVRQVVGEKDSALLVRGEDAYGYFEHERSPVADLDPEDLARHRISRERQEQILFRGTGRTGFM